MEGSDHDLLEVKHQQFFGRDWKKKRQRERERERERERDVRIVSVLAKIQTA